MPKSKNIGIFHPILIPGKNKHDFYDVLAQSFRVFIVCLVGRFKWVGPIFFGVFGSQTARLVYRTEGISSPCPSKSEKPGQPTFGARAKARGVAATIVEERRRRRPRGHRGVALVSAWAVGAAPASTRTECHGRGCRRAQMGRRLGGATACHPDDGPHLCEGAVGRVADELRSGRAVVGHGRGGGREYQGRTP
jgi:hypothetical protein